MEDDPKQYNATKIQLKVKQYFVQMEDNLKFFWKMGDDLKKNNVTKKKVKKKKYWKMEDNQKKKMKPKKK